MSACTHDGNGQIVPLAIGIADIENQENWSYFLEQLRTAMPKINSPGFVIMHDREKGLHGAQLAVLPEAHESICVFHLEKNVTATFKPKAKLLAKIWEIAKATTITDYNKAMHDIQEMNAGVAAYICASDPRKWATAKFPVPRFGCVTSNSAESMNSWLAPLRDKSHLFALMQWVSNVGELMYERHRFYASANTPIVQSVQERYNRLLKEGSRLLVKQYSDTGFEVQNPITLRNYIVELSNGTCTCGAFIEFQFPCQHAAIAITKAHLSPSVFMHKSYLLQSLQAVYCNHITPISTDELDSDELTLQPKIAKKTGRPKVIKFRNRRMVTVDKQLACSRCGTKGHNVRTCERRQAQLDRTKHQMANGPLQMQGHVSAIAPTTTGNEQQQQPSSIEDHIDEEVSGAGQAWMYVLIETSVNRLAILAR